MAPTTPRRMIIVGAGFSGSLEMGATWVHWMQPFVWTEITRYGQDICPSPDIEQAYWVSGGGMTPAPSTTSTPH